jgi:hypothetical protein
MEVKLQIHVFLTLPLDKGDGQFWALTPLPFGK